MNLTQINRILITPGHGQGDPGAVANTGRTESEDVVKICQYIQELYNNDRINGLLVEVIDPNNSLGLQSSIDLINSKYGAFNPDSDNNVLAIEIHQDQNAPYLPLDQQNSQMGVYYYESDENSKSLASSLVQKFISYGAYNVLDGDQENFTGTWRREHYLPWAGFYLGFIHNINAWSLIIECGFVSGTNSDQDLRRYAFWIFQAIKEIKTGNILNQKPRPIMESQPNQIADPRFIKALENSYYYNIYKDRNIELVLADITDRDDEIAKLKAELEKKAKVQDYPTPILVNLPKVENIVPQNQPQPAFDKPAVTWQGKDESTSNILTIRDNIKAGHIFEVIIALAAGLGAFLAENNLNPANFTSVKGFLVAFWAVVITYLSQRKTPAGTK